MFLLVLIQFLCDLIVFSQNFFDNFFNSSITFCFNKMYNTSNEIYNEIYNDICNDIYYYISNNRSVKFSQFHRHKMRETFED